MFDRCSMSQSKDIELIRQNFHSLIMRANIMVKWKSNNPNLIYVNYVHNIIFPNGIMFLRFEERFEETRNKNNCLIRLLIRQFILENDRNYRFFFSCTRTSVVSSVARGFFQETSINNPAKDARRPSNLLFYFFIRLDFLFNLLKKDHDVPTVRRQSRFEGIAIVHCARF
jgi:hypothetical protein